MPSASVPGHDASARRVPRQARARERVERILDGASRVALESGIDALSTRSIAAASDMPVASIYQYFADKDAVLLAICERDMAEMDEQVATDLAAADVTTMRTLVDVTMRAFVKVYHRRPAFMKIWMRGRTNTAVYDYGRTHNRRTAENLLAFAVDAGLVSRDQRSADELTRIAELAVEVGDRAFQLAFERDVRGDDFVIDEAIELVTGYLNRIATATAKGAR